MARIRVDTEELKANAKVFESTAESIAKAGEDILATAMSLPSYDGQLSGPARAAGYEIQRQSRENQANLAASAKFLKNAATAFEEVENQTIEIIASAIRDVSYPVRQSKREKLSFVSPDDSILYGPFHGIWFTYNSDSWNPFIRGHRESNISGKLSNDADKWIGYEDVLDNPNKVAIWYNPLPPQPLPNPPNTPRIYNKDDIYVQAFLLAAKNLDLAYKLISANIPDIFEIGMDAEDLMEVIEGIAKGGASFLKGIGLAVETIANYQDLLDACSLFETSYNEIQDFGEKLFSGNSPYEPYFPYGSETLTPMKPTPIPPPTPPTPSWPETPTPSP